MADDKPLTKSDLISVLKQVGVATKDDIRLAIEASEKRVDKRIDNLEQRLKDHVSDEVTQMAKDIIETAETLHNEVIERLDNLELNTVKRTEFEALKRKVERYHPVS